MIVASTPARDLNMSEGRGLVNKLSKLLKGGPRSALQSNPLPYGPPSGPKTTFFRRTKSISSASSCPNATHGSPVASPVSETSEASSSRSSDMHAQKLTAGRRRFKNTAVGLTQSRIFDDSTMSRTSAKPRAPSPPSLYASFAFGDPVKKPPRSLPLDPKRRKARATLTKSKGQTLRSVESKNQLSDTSSRPPTAASFSGDDLSSPLLRGNADIKFATSEYSVDSIAWQSNWPVRNGQYKRRARLSRVDDEGDDIQIVTTSSTPLSNEASMTPLTTQLMKVPSAGELRQRNKDKLARTLGENVPEHLLRHGVYEEDEKKGYSVVEEPPKEELGQMSLGEEADTGNREVPLHRPKPRPLLTISTSLTSVPVSRVRSISSASSPSPIVFMHNILTDISLGTTPSSSGTGHSAIAFKSRDNPPNGTPLTPGSSEPDSQSNKEVPDEVTGNYTTSPPTSKSTSNVDGSSTNTSHNRGTSEQIPGSMSSPPCRSASVQERRTRSALSLPIHPDPSAPFAPYALGSNQFLPSEATTNATLSGVQRRDSSRGWSGEWNQADMRDVIRKLRDLK